MSRYAVMLLSMLSALVAASVVLGTDVDTEAVAPDSVLMQAADSVAMPDTTVATETEARSVTLRFRANRTRLVRNPETQDVIKRYVGDVRFEVSPEVWLQADEMDYSSGRRVAHMTGRVLAADSGRTLTASRAVYYHKGNEYAVRGPRLDLLRNVTLRDSQRTVTAQRIVYHTEIDSIEAFGGVVLRQEASVLQAERAEIDARRRNMTAWGDVIVVDSTEDVTIRAGWYSFRDEDSTGIVARRPVLMMGSGDTAVTVRADSMRLTGGGRSATAWDSVRITRGSLTARCDSVVYDTREEVLRLYGTPWAEQRTRLDSSSSVSSLEGGAMTLALDGSRVRSITVTGRARGVTRESGPADEEQGDRWIAGDRIVFHLAGEAVRRVDVFGQARSHYVPTAGNRQEEGRNEASADTMVLHISSGRMTTVELCGGVQGVFYPPPEDTTRTEQEPIQ